MCEMRVNVGRDCGVNRRVFIFLEWLRTVVGVPYLVVDKSGIVFK